MPHPTIPASIVHIGVPVAPIPQLRSFHLSFETLHQRELYYIDTSPSSLSVLLEIYHPAFCFHIMTIVHDAKTEERPTIQTDGDCWVVRDGILHAVAVGARVKHGRMHSAFVCYLYDCPISRKEIIDVGLLVVPTRNTTDPIVTGRPAVGTTAEHLREYSLPEYWDIRRGIASGAHAEVQLTFHPRECPQLVEAESVYTSAEFMSVMRHTRDWDELFG